MRELAVGGLLPLTTIDFPGRLAAVVFLKGCNLRCRYCHNPDLLDPVPDGIPHRGNALTWKKILEFFRQRKNFLEGVVFSGGEPTIQEGLTEAMKDVRALGLEVALHTNGCFPDKLDPLLAADFLSFVALDVKAPFGEYHLVTRVGSGDQVKESVAMVLKSGIRHEIRTTVHPSLIDDQHLLEMASSISKMGVKKFVLQKFQFGRIFDPQLMQMFGDFVRSTTIAELNQLFENFQLREDIPRRG